MTCHDVDMASHDLYDYVYLSKLKTMLQMFYDSVCMLVSYMDWHLFYNLSHSSKLYIVG